MDLNTKPAGWAKRTGLLAMVVLTGACSDMGTEPSALDSSDPRFNGGGTSGPPPAVVLGLDPEHLTFEGVDRRVTSSSCSSPTNGTFTYYVTGQALGNYEGTFTETGTVTISGGIVTALYAKFTIIGKSLLDPDGPDYKIKGSKELTIGGPGECLTVGAIVDPGVAGTLKFVAKIYTPSGHRFTDRGTSQLVMEEVFLPPSVTTTTFNESFFSDLPGGPTICVDVEVGIGVGRTGLDTEIEECPPDLDL